MIDIWNKCIQELTSSRDEESLRLAYALVDDKELFMTWIWTSDDVCDRYELPYLYWNYAAWANVVLGHNEQDWDFKKIRWAWEDRKQAFLWAQSQSGVG